MEKYIIKLKKIDDDFKDIFKLNTGIVYEYYCNYKELYANKCYIEGVEHIDNWFDIVFDMIGDLTNVVSKASLELNVTEDQVVNRYLSSEF